MLSIYIASMLFPEISISSPETIFWAGLVLALAHLFLRPILLLLSLPINLITLGLFTLVINTGLVMLTDCLIGGLYIPSFSLSFAVAFIVLVSTMISNLFIEE